MIFVTVGMHRQGFDRLISAMDELARKTEEPVVMQIGAARHEPAHAAEWFRYGDQQLIEEMYQAARVVVGHAGVGTIVDSIRLGRPLIIVPRRSEYKEHIDNHQLDLVEALQSSGKVVTVFEASVEELERGIALATTLAPPEFKPSTLVEAVAQFLEAEQLKMTATKN